MICRLCLKTSPHVLNIFDEAAAALDISQIIGEHFWFEPKYDDPISTSICETCWDSVRSFHDFYKSVQEAHHLLAERYSVVGRLPVKTENNKPALSQTADQTESVCNAMREEPSGVNIVDNNELIIDKTQTEVTHRVTRARVKMQTAADEQPSAKMPKTRQTAMLTTTEEDLKIAQHTVLSCAECNDVSPTFVQLRKHMKDAHNCRGYAVCCNKKYFRRSYLLDHIDHIQNPNKFCCTECNKQYADRQCLRNHIFLKHMPDEVKIYKCAACPLSFGKKYLLEQHSVVHNERTYSCKDCQRRFPSASMLTTHVRLIHSNSGIICEICAKVFMGSAALKRHQLEHTGVQQPIEKCHICGSVHNNKYNLQKHIRRHNIEQNRYVCEICGKIAPNCSALRSHERYVHKASRAHKCDVCSKAFKTSSNLREHLAMHKSEALYHCAHCDRAFNCSSNLHSHRKKMHPKEFEAARKARLAMRTEGDAKFIDCKDGSSEEQQASTESVTIILNEELCLADI